MKKLGLHKTLTLAALLSLGSVGIASHAMANGGGGVGGEFIAGDRLATGGTFECSEAVRNTCPDVSAFQSRSNVQPSKIANHQSREPYPYRY